MACNHFECYEMPSSATLIPKAEMQILFYFGTADGTQSFNWGMLVLMWSEKS